MFKINPGPMYNAGLRIQSRSLTTGNRHIKKSSRNTGNLIKINCSMDVAALNRNRAQSLLLCSLNPRSVRNKTADMFDYVCDCKADLFAFTETWLRDDDDAVEMDIRSLVTTGLEDVEVVPDLCFEIHLVSRKLMKGSLSLSNSLNG